MADALAAYYAGGIDGATESDSDFETMVAGSEQPNEKVKAKAKTKTASRSRRRVRKPVHKPTCKYGIKCFNIDERHIAKFVHPHGHDPYLAKYRNDAALSSETESGSTEIESKATDSYDGFSTIDVLAPGDDNSLVDSELETDDGLGSASDSSTTIGLAAIPATPSPSSSSRSPDSVPHSVAAAALRAQLRAPTGSPIMLTTRELAAAAPTFKLWKPPPPPCRRAPLAPVNR
ncbi:uncharacterized protein AMSG_00569 [Thecamonas trahens ATCC 50062]|uniref:Uncharacterized protein n=1 Tax=Thecamonas trahens ATCC 50062 TaxID=461836 RepID=A0A0L0D975_THETB|nr:hypothetical protein AMSG_00569 [Thecamonas trahens ATCC 50062]KNC48790.1 hypothetical protein AMSG_00569 [Thecamonas trahens ATCC 50062]|eukprot:XP_013762841.1 hypothetical protein AMSG_00569 [Thecamonas trahens ATCC 50062]